jgi:ribonuclease R
MEEHDELIANVYDVFESNPEAQYTVDTLARIMHMSGAAAFKNIVKVVTELENDHHIVVINDNRYQLAPLDEVVTGVFHAHEKGFGFVSYDPDQQDVFIPKGKSDTAIDGDTVVVTLVRGGNPWKKKGPEGYISGVVERKITRLVGEFFQYSDAEVAKTGMIGYAQSHEKKLSQYSIFLSSEGVHPQMGDMVLLEITQYPTAQTPTQMQGIVLKTLGNKNEPGVDILSIVYDHGLHDEFPQEVLDQANAIPDTVQPEDKVNRKDITDQPMVTIDGDDSKDFDDAVAVWRLPNGNFHLGVSIADVSHYVTEGSPLDQEAYDRSFSTYLADRVIPMLPFRLSNGICSLNPGVERLTLTCDMEIDDQGQIVKHTIYPSVMKSAARMTYNNVNKIIQDRDPALREQYSQLTDMFDTMGELHEILFNMRHRRGAIDFEDTEAKIIVDKDSKPVDIVLRERGTAERMIESFMLAANETVAKEYYLQHVPFLYRVHETPDQDRIQSFYEFVSAFGIHPKGGTENVQPKALQDILAQVAGTPEEAVVNTMMLRSLKQAHYSDELLGHFGLAAKYYTHFTSPIRRYPDLIVHRMIHQYAQSGEGQAEKDKWHKVLPDIAEQTSTQERKSVDTERDVDDLLKTEYMEKHVDEEFDAVIASVTSFGMFIALPNTVEGLVHISTIGDDFYSFDDKQLALLGRSTHKMYRIGQAVKVKLVSANVTLRQLNFELVLSPEEQKRADQRKERMAQYGNSGNYSGPRKTMNGPRHRPGNNRSNQRRNNNNNNNRTNTNSASDDGFNRPRIVQSNKHGNGKSNQRH